MKPFFGYHMPNFSFPGVPDDALFDRMVESAKAAEAAGFDLVTPLPTPAAIALGGELIRLMSRSRSATT